MQIDDADAFALILRDGTVHAYRGTAAVFDDLEHAQTEHAEMILAVPFRQALYGDRPTSDAERSSRSTVSAIRVHEHREYPADEFLRGAGGTPPQLLDGHFDVTDEEYAERVRAVVSGEIAAGHGSNFVLHRTYRGRVHARDAATEMSVFRALASRESSAYWTFLVRFPDHTLIGASPEMHLRRSADGVMTMNPISGTYRYPRRGPEESSLRAFLRDPKERNELYMVVDEELKIMSDLCDDRPWVSGPGVRFMADLAHTEYHIHGTSSLPWSEAIRRSLIAPTIIGSPLESAFRMAQRNDLSPRGYLGGVLAHVGAGEDVAFDSAILIRTACVESTGEVAIPIGSTIVRDSESDQEAAETAAKASGMLSAFTRGVEVDLQSVADEELGGRAGEVAQFWGHAPSGDQEAAVVPQGLRALIIDFEDRFTGMLAAHLKALGLDVTVVVGSPTEQQLAEAQLLVLGPGPGYPGDETDPRIVGARKLARWAVETRSIPTLAVCLSHQLVSRALGLDVRRLAQTNQGSQRTITLFGEEARVGFYNSFSAFDDGQPRADIELSSDPDTGEVYALRSTRLIGLQFHPESILSVDGAAVLRRCVTELVGSTHVTTAA